MNKQKISKLLTLIMDINIKELDFDMNEVSILKNISMDILMEKKLE